MSKRFGIVKVTYEHKCRILEKRVVDQIQKSADQILNMQLG